MLVFKNYLRIAKTYIALIMIYTVIFVGIAAITSSTGNQSTSAFEANTAKIAVINHDSDTPLIQSFIDYMKESSEYVELEDNEDSLRDALFFRKAEFIMTIPKGFTQDFLDGKDIKIVTKEVPNSSGAVYSKTLMNKYLNTVKLYLRADISTDEMIQSIQKDLSIHTSVDMMNPEHNDVLNSVASFYNFSNYTLLSIIISIVTMIMISFRNEKIRRRNIISSTSYQSLNRQLLMGNLVVAFGVWLLYVLCSIGLYKDVVFTISGLLLILNSFVFVIFILILSFFITTLTQNRELASGISTVVGLGSSFIAGAFVPQQFLAPFVIQIAKLTPSYWFITNNNEIAKLASWTLKDLQPIFLHMGIVIGFSLFFYMLIQLISKMKLKRG